MGADPQTLGKVVETLVLGGEPRGRVGREGSAAAWNTMVPGTIVEVS